MRFVPRWGDGHVEWQSWPNEGIRMFDRSWMRIRREGWASTLSYSVT
ncbi:hypothetical protein [Streptosporangium subroseum]|nr:hypothetical protein OHB15_08415 [Streptosporangium subroseum]